MWDREGVTRGEPPQDTVCLVFLTNRKQPSLNQSVIFPHLLTNHLPPSPDPKPSLRHLSIQVPECDGIRLISTEACELLQRVPSSSEDIFKVGSVAPAALLYDAAEVGAVYVHLYSCLLSSFLVNWSFNEEQQTLT